MPKSRMEVSVPEFVPYPARASDYGVWLAARAPWQLFVTLTLGDRAFGQRSAGATHIGVAGAERFLRGWFRNSVRSRSYAYGTTAYAVFAMEAHSWRSTPHFHGLVGGVPRWMEYDVAAAHAMKDYGRSFIWAEWDRAHGMARMERVRESVSVAGYVSKYVTKGAGKLYAFGTWPQVSEYDDPANGEENYARWQAGPGSRNAERMWRELCEAW
jgi:hypothetical protein